MVLFLLRLAFNAFYAVCLTRCFNDASYPVRIGLVAIFWQLKLLLVFHVNAHSLLSILSTTHSCLRLAIHTQ